MYWSNLKCYSDIQQKGWRKSLPQHWQNLITIILHVCAHTACLQSGIKEEKGLQGGHLEGEKILQQCHLSRKHMSVFLSQFFIPSIRV